MPVEFLSDAEAAAYGRFDGCPSREELDRVFFLDDADRELIDKRRGPPNQLGFALQLTTVRWLGTFLPDPTDVPPVVLAYVGRQLEIEDPSCVVRYLERRRTRFEHAEEIAGGSRPRRARCCTFRAIPTGRSLAGCATEISCTWGVWRSVRLRPLVTAPSISRSWLAKAGVASGSPACCCPVTR